MANVRPLAWSQLPSQTRSDLAQIGGRQWYEGIRPEHRVGSLNVYMKLKQADLWKHVDRVVLPAPAKGGEPGTGPEEVGKFDFIAKDAAKFRADLAARSDFSDPGSGPLDWKSRQDVDECSLHFKQFSTNPGYVNAHVDQAGLSWYNPVSWIRHLYDYAIDGYQDVGQVNTMLRRHGLDWTRPITPQAAPRVEYYPGPRVGGTRQRVGSLVGTQVGGPFRFEARAIGRQTPDLATGSFPSVSITARPRSSYLPNSLGRLSGRGGRPAGSLSTRPQAYDFSVRELPGEIRTGPRGRIEFPGVQVTAHPRPNLLRELGDHLEHTPTPQASRFNWSVRALPQTGPGRTQSAVPSLRFTAEPRPNLLRELGDRLRDTPDHYRFSAHQEPGGLRSRPGGGVEFPPIHVIAHPAQPNLLRQLGNHLERGPGSTFTRR